MGARAVRTGAKAVRTGQVFLVWKVILEFFEGPSGRANLSDRTEAVQTLLGSIRMLKLQYFF
jgi:hypothetical protein